jgi:hypothetical protein
MIDRNSFWFGVSLGFVFGLVLAAFVFEVCKWFDAHTIIIR